MCSDSCASPCASVVLQRRDHTWLPQEPRRGGAWSSAPLVLGEGSVGPDRRAMPLPLWVPLSEPITVAVLCCLLACRPTPLLHSTWGSLWDYLQPAISIWWRTEAFLLFNVWSVSVRSSIRTIARLVECWTLCHMHQYLPENLLLSSNFKNSKMLKVQQPIIVHKQVTAQKFKLSKRLIVHVISAANVIVSLFLYFLKGDPIQRMPCVI